MPGLGTAARTVILGPISTSPNSTERSAGVHVPSHALITGALVMTQTVSPGSRAQILLVPDGCTAEEGSDSLFGPTAPNGIPLINTTISLPVLRQVPRGGQLLVLLTVTDAQSPGRVAAAVSIGQGVPTGNQQTTPAGGQTQFQSAALAAQAFAQPQP